MKILQINTNQLTGGAARAAYRIHHALIKKNIDSYLYVQKKVCSDDNLNKIIGLNSKMDKLKISINLRTDNMYKKIFHICSTKPWSVNNPVFKNAEKINFNNYDIINLHWINGGFMSIESIGKIKQPIVWTLHDSWPFTGGCHIPYECKKYTTQCSNCEHCVGNTFFDLSKWVFRRKTKSYPTNMIVVSPSKWLAQCARDSFLFHKCDIRVIPNGINLASYRPQNKLYTREILGLDVESKIILFGAMGIESDTNKGFECLYKAIITLYQKHYNDKVEIIIFGGDEPKEEINFGFKTTYVGLVHDDITLNVLFSAADVMVVPSRSENLPNVIIESMACGTPCVAFDIGGIPDIIEHYVNGYLATPHSYEDLAKGIEYVLLDFDRNKSMSENARNTVIDKFNINKTANEYISLYEEIMRNK